MSAWDDDLALARLQVPPHSVEAEQSVLGGLLLDNSAWGRAGDVLTEADFYRSEHRLIFAAIAALIARNEPADVITVFEHLQSRGTAVNVGDLAYLNSLAQSVPSAANVRRYAGIVKEKAIRRAIIAAASDAGTIAWGTEDNAHALDRIATLFGQLERQQVRKMPRPIAEVAAERLADYQALADGTATAGWPTHIPGLDWRLNGGVQPGRLYILAARPSVGKSSFAQHLAQTFACDGLPTLLLSLEMGAKEVADRGVANIGRVSYSALLSGKMAPKEWERTAEAADTLGTFPMHVDDQPALTLRDIRIKARSVKGLKVLVLDYLQLCAGGSGRRDMNRNSEIEEISRGLKALAMELGVAVFALSQLNRDVEKRSTKRPMLSDLRDSGAIEQDADVVLFLWTVRELEAEGRRIVGLGIDKNRQGRIGELGLDFYGDMQRWGESTADIRPPKLSSGNDL